MEKINGEWIMNGCREDDPACLHTAEELKSFILRTGFLPLFANPIKGFSVEEMTTPHSWWTGDPASDPWEWRQILASDPDLTYGKFFDKKAGFVSREWFPVFANYRRNGYDFEALCSDELVPYRNRKVMDAFRLNEELAGRELMSFEIRRESAVEKGFEGILTELQMQTFLIVSAFRQKKNRLGEAYGWHVAAFITPETKWGYDYVSSGYREEPAVSREKMAEQIRRHFSGATDAEMEKVMAIRYPGEEAKPAKRKPPAKKTGSRQIPPFPEGMIAAAGVQEMLGCSDYKGLNEDQLAGLDYALGQLKEQEQEILLYRFRDGLTFREIGEKYGRSVQRMRQILAKSLRKLRHPVRAHYVRYGLTGYAEKQKEDMEFLKTAMENPVAIGDKVRDLEIIHIDELGLNTREYNCLMRCGISNLGQLLDLMSREPFWHVKIRNRGPSSFDGIMKRLAELGIINNSQE